MSLSSPDWKRTETTGQLRSTRKRRQLSSLRKGNNHINKGRNNCSYETKKLKNQLLECGCVPSNVRGMRNKWEKVFVIPEVAWITAITEAWYSLRKVNTCSITGGLASTCGTEMTGAVVVLFLVENRLG